MELLSNGVVALLICVETACEQELSVVDRMRARVRKGGGQLDLKRRQE